MDDPRKRGDSPSHLNILRCHDDNMFLRLFAFGILVFDDSSISIRLATMIDEARHATNFRGVNDVVFIQPSE